MKEKKREVPLEIIQAWLRDTDCDVRQAAMNACQGREVPLEIIRAGLRDADWRVRQAAMNACQGREVPLEIIQAWLRDTDWRVRQAAMNACQFNNIPIPVVRTFEPPELVYKKCIGGIIVIASIPQDAQIRGSFGCKCRASKAVINGIIGDLYGEKVGISKYDLKTLYYDGDVVEIDDFDCQRQSKIVRKRRRNFVVFRWTAYRCIQP